MLPISKQQFMDAFEDVEEDKIDLYLDVLNAAMSEFNIDNAKRVSMFLAQCCHESSYFRLVKENLNYSADGLRRVFPKYFRDVDADDYNRQPEKIANRVYANRMGNGDEDSGDGWSFHGRGLIQLTGKDNYKSCGDDLGRDLISDPSYLETPEGAARSAAWFWDMRNLNEQADADDIVLCTKKINGGLIGLDERTKLWKAALEELN
jgi:putative chitinase